MMNAPVLQVDQSNHPGNVQVMLECEGPVLLLYTIETGYGPMPFLPCAHLPATGGYTVTGLPNNCWVTLYAVHVDPDDDTDKLSPPSNLERVRTTAKPAYRLTVSRLEQLEHVAGRTNAFSMIMRLVESLGVSKKAFLYRRENFGGTLGYRDVFMGVCKIGDFAYPEDEPNLTISPLFRSDIVTPLDRSPIALHEDWCILLHDLDELVYALNIWQEGQQSI
jgi:hypothetical protein